MLTGTLASMIVQFQPQERQVAILVSGVAYQGCGWCVSFVAVVLYIKSLMDAGLPVNKARPAMFIPVGSCAYTVVALVGMARGVDVSSHSSSSSSSVAQAGDYLARHPNAPEILRVMALFTSIFLYAFAFWLFAIALLANISVVGKMPFSLAWWAFIFPNVGFALATSALGRELESNAILWVASIMTALLVVVWTIAAVSCVRAVWKGEIVWPGKDEDKDR
jgi:tellurite resistance protein TehA-like permease